MEKQLAIIDPVGIKSGMNHYNDCLCNSLVQQGVKPYIYSNYKATHTSIQYRAFFGRFFSNKLIQLFNLLKALFQSCLDCKRNHINVVIVHVFSTHHMAFLTFLFLKLFGLKTITISHDVSSFTNQDNPFYHNLIYNRWSNYIVVHNAYSKSQLLPLIGKSVHATVRVIKHGAFLDLVDRSVASNEAQQHLALDPKYKYLLFFGRLKTTKRLDILLEAMPYIHSNTRLIIAGKPVNGKFDAYQQIIDRLSIAERVILDIEYITDAKRDWYFQASDATVLPYEVIFQSGVLLMSMSYGLPVIASDIPTFKELIQHQHNGLLFESLNPMDLARKVNDLMDSKTMRLTISNGAIQTMKNDYSWDDIAKQYKAIID